ncbi:MAG: triose-phosphate isomerase [Firmicutes bacterium]|nr:triose-phosphate isomerase [Bacillota bacterium]
MRRKFICGNWKMYKTRAEALAFAEQIKPLLTGDLPADVAVAVPYTQIWALTEAFAGTPMGVGAQNVHFADEGAYTGEVSVPMLKETGVSCCIVGHSERRQYFAETDETVNKKLRKLFADSSIRPILCVSETLEERAAGAQEEIVRRQLEKDLEGLDADMVSRLVIAYEPIWAIGMGRTASPEQAQEMCACIRSLIASLYDAPTAGRVIIQYGGSVKPVNAGEILSMPDIDGALVGGASLKPDDFMKIVDSLKIQ